MWERGCEGERPDGTICCEREVQERPRDAEFSQIRQKDIMLLRAIVEEKMTDREEFY